MDFDEAPSKETIDVLDEIIDLQAFDGHWSLDDNLCKSIGKSIEQINNETRALFGSDATDESITAYVLVFIYEQFADKEDLWNQIFNKAIRYLKSTKFDQVFIDGLLLRIIEIGKTKVV